MTIWWPLAPTATTRSSDGMPSGGPASMRAWPVRAAACGLRGRQHRHQPVRARRHVGDPALGVEHLDGERPGGDGDRAGQPVLVDERGHLDRALPGRVVEPADQGHPQGIDQEHRRAGQGERQPGRGDQRQPGPQAPPPPPPGGPAPLAGHGQPPSAASRYPAPRTVCRAFFPNGTSILRRRYPA